jgi:hypothetical protein
LPFCFAFLFSLFLFEVFIANIFCQFSILYIPILKNRKIVLLSLFPKWFYLPLLL